MAGKPKTPHLTDAEKKEISDHFEALGKTIMESDGRITSSLIAKQCGLRGNKIATYVSGRRQGTRPVYKRTVEWLAEFKKAFPDGLPPRNAQVRFDASAFVTNDPAIDGPMPMQSADPYGAILDLEADSFENLIGD